MGRYLAHMLRVIKHTLRFITPAVEGHNRSNFYALNGYFVEVELFDEGDAIAAVIPFTTGDRYERMVRNIDLGHLST